MIFAYFTLTLICLFSPDMCTTLRTRCSTETLYIHYYLPRIRVHSSVLIVQPLTISNPIRVEVCRPHGSYSPNTPCEFGVSPQATDCMLLCVPGTISRPQESSSQSHHPIRHALNLLRRNTTDFTSAKS